MWKYFATTTKTSVKGNIIRHHTATAMIGFQLLNLASTAPSHMPKNAGTPAISMPRNWASSPFISKGYGLTPGLSIL